MLITRRTLVRASTAALALPAIARHAFAEEPVRVGWLATFTVPLSSPTIGFDRGVKYAVEQINAKGGVNGRMIEVVARDTQGDPTKAVNATQGRHQPPEGACDLWSGELRRTPRHHPDQAKARMPSLVAGVVNSLIDTTKFPTPSASPPPTPSGTAPSRAYCKNILKAKKVAITADATGYGTSAHDDSMDSFKADGFDIVYDGVIGPGPNPTSPPTCCAPRTPAPR